MTTIATDISQGDDALLASQSLENLNDDQTSDTEDPIVYSQKVSYQRLPEWRPLHQKEARQGRRRSKGNASSGASTSLQPNAHAVRLTPGARTIP